ncbi:MAG: radical SAM protein [Candidatus Krumholzibacteriota bacterium]|nr:radical SAM protein [Candidatus Krumholzibacteriota bacterium]
MNLNFAANQFRNHIMESLSRVFNIPGTRPSRLTMVLTDRCNLNCTFCNLWKRDWPLLSTDSWIRVIDQLHEWLGPLHLVFTGGEPMTREDLTELIRFASDKDCCCEINSNGILINDSMAETLADCGLREANISLMTTDRDVSNLLHGKGDIPERVIEALKSLRNARGGLIQVRVLCTIMAENLDNLQDILAVTEELDLEGVLFQPVYQNFGNNRLGNKWFMENPHWPSDNQKVFECMDKLAEHKKAGRRIVNPLEQLYLIKDYFSDPRKCKKACVASDSSLIIECDGNAYLCVFKPAGPLGNVMDAHPREIWNGETSTRLRNGIRGCKAGCALMNMNYSIPMVDKIRKYFNMYGHLNF